MQENGSTDTWYFASTVSKRRADGVECLSDHVEPGESLLNDTGRHRDATADPQQQ